MVFKRRKEDNMSGDELIQGLMSNGHTTKYLVAKMYVDFTNHFTRINGKIRFHDKFVWAFIGILISGFTGGLIALIINHIICSGG